MVKKQVSENSPKEDVNMTVVVVVVFWGGRGGIIYILVASRHFQ